MVTNIASGSVPVVELAVPVLAVLGFRRASASVALGLLVVFSAAVVRVRVRAGRDVPCGCFGERTTTPTSVQLLRNAALAFAAGLAIAGAPDAAVLRWPGAPERGDVVPAALAAVALAVAVWAAWRSTVWLARGRA
jgi:hypothetical protein